MGAQATHGHVLDADLAQCRRPSSRFQGNIAAVLPWSQSCASSHCVCAASWEASGVGPRPTTSHTSSAIVVAYTKRIPASLSKTFGGVSSVLISGGVLHRQQH